MRILYIANIRFPTEKAHGVQIAKTCEAFAGSGHQVELVVTNRSSSIIDTPFDYYAVRSNFTITRIGVPKTVSWGPAGFLFESLMFSIRAAAYARKWKPDIVYGRDEMPLSFIARALPIVWETHIGSWNVFARFVARRAHQIVTISQGLKEFYMACRVPADRITVAHDGIDLVQFEGAVSKDEARKQLGLGGQKRIAMYIGRLDSWKGTSTLFEASALLPGDITVVVIGGEEKQWKELQIRFPQIVFLGPRPYRELRDIQAAADVLVLPNTGLSTVSAAYTSPLKLFSYMASRRPIVASDLSSIREVLDDSAAFFVVPDDPQALAEGIIQAFGTEGNPRAEEAYALVGEYSWNRRAERILAVLE